MPWDTITQIITTKDAFIAFMVMAGIAAIEAGIIGGLATRVGSLRKLFRITASIADKRAHDADKKRDVPDDTIQE
jgi:hypothetical protein